MTLWNIIRDWFVVYIWGGVSSEGTSYATNVVGTNLNSSDFTLEIGSLTLNLGDWLSTTSTILCLALLVYAVILFLIWLFKFVSGLLLLKR